MLTVGRGCHARAIITVTLRTVRDRSAPLVTRITRRTVTPVVVTHVGRAAAEVRVANNCAATVSKRCRDTNRSVHVTGHSRTSVARVAVNPRDTEHGGSPQVLIVGLRYLGRYASVVTLCTAVNTTYGRTPAVSRHRGLVLTVVVALVDTATAGIRTVTNNRAAVVTRRLARKGDRRVKVARKGRRLVTIRATKTAACRSRHVGRVAASYRRIAVTLVTAVKAGDRRTPAVGRRRSVLTVVMTLVNSTAAKTS